MVVDTSPLGVTFHSAQAVSSARRAASMAAKASLNQCVLKSRIAILGSSRSSLFAKRRSYHTKPQSAKKGYHGFPQKVDLEGDYVYDQKSAVRTMAPSQAAVSLHAFMQEEFTMLGYLAIALGCGMIGYFLARKMF